MGLRVPEWTRDAGMRELQNVVLEWMRHAATGADARMRLQDGGVFSTPPQKQVISFFFDLESEFFCQECPSGNRILFKGGKLSGGFGDGGQGGTFLVLFVTLRNRVWVGEN